MKTDEDNAMMLGVCAGLGNYLDVDPLFIRLAFLFMFFAFGMGVITYLILWVLMN